MGRTKGAKNKPKKRKPIVYSNRMTGVVRKQPRMMSEDSIAEALEKKKATIAQSPALTKLGELDREYLLSTLEVFRATMETIIPIDFPDDVHGNYKYTPREMWLNMYSYFKVSINFGQPLTKTGLAMFCGMDNTSMHRLRTKENLHPDYRFIKMATDFVEMYNEYAAHKKQNPAGPIFILKNMGWKDKFELESTSNPGALTEEERAEAQRRIQNFSEKV